MGSTVHVSAAETDGTRSSYFGRQVKLQQPTALTHEVAAAALKLLREYWSGMPVARLSITLGGLADDSVDQLTLFEDRTKVTSIERTTDRLKDRYGPAAVMRASSMLERCRPRAG